MRPPHVLPLVVMAAQLVVAGVLAASTGGAPEIIALVALAGGLCAVAALRRARSR